jgi:aldose 1-epimerase
MTAKITNYGGILVSLWVPDKNGALKDVVLGYDTMEKYHNNDCYLGAIIGRFGNRIKEGKFSIDGVEYHVAINDGENHLHGGIKGFNSVLWDAKITSEGLKLSYLSKDMEENYPGNLNVEVNYSLSEDNELKIEYKAISDKATPINLTNHSYFNLEGHQSGSILNQVVWLNSDSFTKTDKGSIPTGELVDVTGTPMDFRTPTVVGDRIDADYEQLNFAGGYDHNWKINRSKDGLEKAASIYSPNTGIMMEVSTTLPGIQLYAGNYLGGSVGKLGKDHAIYDKRSGICFETQYFPNCINIPEFESCVFAANEQYCHTTVFKFSVK